MDFYPIFVSVGGWIVTLGVAVLEMRQQQRKFDIEQNKRMEEINNIQEKHLMELKSAQEKQMLEIQASVGQAIAIVECKIDELSKRVEKHNNVVERTFKLESDVALHDEKIKVANNRIADLERK